MKNSNHGKTIRSIVSKAFLIMIILSVVATPMVSPVAADTSEDYSLIWTDINTYGETVGVAMDNSGDVYTLEYGASGTSYVHKMSGSDGDSIYRESISTSGSAGYELIQVNNDGIYVIDQTGHNLLMLDKSDGSQIDSASLLSDNYYEISAQGSNVYVMGGDPSNDNGVQYEFTSSATGLTQDSSQTTGNAGWHTGEIDENGNEWNAYALSGESVALSGSDGEANILQGSGSTATVNDTSGSATPQEAYFGDEAGYITKFTWSGSGDIVASNQQSISGSGDVDASSYDDTFDVVGFGDSLGNVYVRQASDLSVADSFAFADTSDVTGVAMNDGKLAAVQQDGSIRYWSLPDPNPIESISLDVDNQLIQGQSDSYTVTATHQDSSTSDVTGSSSVASDDSSIVSVNEGTATVSYQSDGSTVVRANYTNSTGDLLWSNVTVQTDTPVITLNVNKSSMEYLDVGSYTVTNETFGTSTNVSLSASVTSDNTTVVTVDEPNLQYNAQTSVGIANLTAQDGSFTSSEVQISVTEPQAITWANWEFLSGGERALLIFSDWTILWLLGSVLVSVMFVKWHRSPKLGAITFGALSVIGWITGFVPGYVILSETIFGGFVLFVMFWSPSGES